jgi:hypothetical protein
MMETTRAFATTSGDSLQGAEIRSGKIVTHFVDLRFTQNLKYRTAYTGQRRTTQKISWRNRMILLTPHYLAGPRSKPITALPQVAVELMNTHRLKSLMEIAYVCTQKRSLHDVTMGNAGTD